MADAQRNSVLIPTGLEPSTVLCTRSLSEAGVHTIVASEYEELPVRVSRFCDESVVIPSPDDDLLAHKDALLGISARPDVRTIVPIRAHHPYLFSKYREEFEKYVTLVAPSVEALEQVHDRLRLAEVAEAAGVPVPETRSLDEVEDWDRERIVKSRYNILTDGYVDSYSPNESRIVKSIRHLRPGEIPDEDEIVNEMGHVPIVQEYVPSSDEYVFGALYDHGEALTTYQHRQIRGNSYTGGGGVYRKSVHVPELEETARRLLDSLDWHGLACIEYMKDANTGEFVLTEINPRMWQSLPCAIRAGADFPRDFWYLATGQPELIEPGYEVGVGSHQLYGELGHLLSVLHDDSPLVERPSFIVTLWNIITSCYEMPYFDTLQWDDPLPFTYSVYYFLRNRL